MGSDIVAVTEGGCAENIDFLLKMQTSIREIAGQVQSGDFLLSMASAILSVNLRRVNVKKKIRKKEPGRMSSLVFVL